MAPDSLPSALQCLDTTDRTQTCHGDAFSLLARARLWGPWEEDSALALPSEHPVLGADRPGDPRVNTGVKSVSWPEGCPASADTWGVSLTPQTVHREPCEGGLAARASGNSPNGAPLMPTATARSAGRHRPLWSLHRLVFDFRFLSGL